MKVETIHNIAQYSSAAVFAGSVIAIAAAPTTLTVTVTAAALCILSAQVEGASRRAYQYHGETMDGYYQAFKGEFTLRRAAILTALMGAGFLTCVRMADLLAPPKFAIRDPIR